MGSLPKHTDLLVEKQLSIRICSMTHKKPYRGLLAFHPGCFGICWRGGKTSVNKQSFAFFFAGEAAELVVILIYCGSETCSRGPAAEKKFCHPGSWVSPSWLTVSLFPRNVSVMGGHGCIIIIQLHLNKCTWLCKECYRPTYPAVPHSHVVRLKDCKVLWVPWKKKEK